MSRKRNASLLWLLLTTKKTVRTTEQPVGTPRNLFGRQKKIIGAKEHVRTTNKLLERQKNCSCDKKKLVRTHRKSCSDGKKTCSNDKKNNSDGKKNCRPNNFFFAVRPNFSGRPNKFLSSEQFCLVVQTGFPSDHTCLEKFSTSVRKNLEKNGKNLEWPNKKNYANTTKRCNYSKAALFDSL